MEPSPKKVCKKMSEEEKASGISVKELTKKESLIEEFVERDDTIQAKAESASKKQLKDNETAEDIRKKAMESLKETKKRNSEGGASPKRHKSRRAEPLVEFLREKAAADREIRQQELRAKQHEQESQQQMIKALMLQQQQMNTAFLSVVKKRLDK